MDEQCVVGRLVGRQALINNKPTYCSWDILGGSCEYNLQNFHTFPLDLLN
jgi:hypothetical protein